MLQGGLCCSLLLPLGPHGTVPGLLLLLPVQLDSVGPLALQPSPKGLLVVHDDAPLLVVGLGPLLPVHLLQGLEGDSTGVPLVPFGLQRSHWLSLGLHGLLGRLGHARALALGLPRHRGAGGAGLLLLVQLKKVLHQSSFGGLLVHLLRLLCRSRQCKLLDWHLVDCGGLSGGLGGHVFHAMYFEQLI